MGINKVILDGRRGFTLVEIIIALGVFGLIMIAGTSFLIQTIQNANLANIQNEVRQNAGKIFQDMISETRKAYCVYYESPSAPFTGNALFRLSDDPNGVKCAAGNRVEYYQDPNGVVTKVATDSGGVGGPVGVLSSGNVAVLDCSFGGSACGLSSGCNSGLVVTSNGSPIATPIINGAPATVTLRAQQLPGQTRSDFCATVKLADTITPRVK